MISTGSPPPPPPPGPSSLSPCPQPVVGALARMRATLLDQAAVLAALLALSTCLTESQLCPRSLDCARAGRHLCKPGNSHCGPCLLPLVESSHGRCVVKRRHVAFSAQSSKNKLSTYTGLDEEIDFLSAIITEQRSQSRPPALPVQDASEPKSKHLSVPGTDHRASFMEQPSSQSDQITSVAPLNTTTNHTTAMLSDPLILPYPSNDHVFIIMSSVFILTGSLALIIAGAFWVRLQRGVPQTQKVDYPLYGLMRAHALDSLPGDKKLAQSAQMYHYQHQKQQMLSLEKHRVEQKVPDSGASTDEENEDGDFTVYECPGLAPTGEMEVKNPLFDDSTLYFQKFHK